MNRKTRNGMIELVRFLATVGIAIFHFEWLYNGGTIYCTHFYIYVELFFVITGFFMVINIINSKNSLNSWKYVWNQVKKLYPIYISGFLMTFVISNWIAKVPVQSWGEALWKAKWEILLLVESGFTDGCQIYNLGGAPSYISSLLFASLFLHFLIKKNQEIFKNLVGPIIILSGLARIINGYGNISQWMIYDGFFSVGLLRGLVDMSIGAMAALLLVPELEKLTGKKRTSAQVMSGVLTILQFWGLVHFRNHISYTDLILWIFIFAIIIAIIYVCNINLSFKIHTFFIGMGKISFPIFVFHYPIILVLKHLGLNLEYSSVLILYVLIIVMFAGCVKKIQDCFYRKGKIK